MSSLSVMDLFTYILSLQHNFIGEKKLAKVICPDKWKDGARNTTVGTSSTAGRKLGENKLLSKKRVTAKFNPYAVSKCKTCKSNVHQDGAMYCQGKRTINLNVRYSQFDETQSRYSIFHY